MKTTFLFLMVSALLTYLSSMPTLGQSTPRYSDVIGMNPNADRDIALVGDFLKAIVAGDQDKARSMVSPNYIHVAFPVSDESDKRENDHVHRLFRPAGDLSAVRI